MDKIFYRGERSLGNKECPFHSLSTRSIFSLSKKQMSSSLKSILINYQKNPKFFCAKKYMMLVIKGVSICKYVDQISYG